METFVLDTFAIVAFFRNENGANDVEKHLLDALNGKCQLYMCSYNAGEVYYSLWRKNGKAIADECLKKLLQFDITIIEPDLQGTFEAATI